MSKKQRPGEQAPRRFAAAECISELFATLYAGARKTARRRMGPELAARDSPSDIAQSAVLELLKRADQIEYRGEGAARALIDRVVRSKLSRRASRGRAAAAVALAASEHGGRDQEAGPASAVALREQIERMQGCIDDLSPHERDVMRLWMEGHTHPEIAAALGLSLANSYKLFSRARSKLEARLADREPSQVIQVLNLARHQRWAKGLSYRSHGW